MLKDLGLSLEQISELLREDLSADQIRGMLLLKQAEAKDQIRDAQAQLTRVEARLKQIEKGGRGALFDLGSHVVDLMRFLLGDYQDVMARLHTFITEWPDPKRPGDKEKVDVDDLAILQVKMADGSFGVIEASRVATGANDDLCFELHGTKGALMFNLMEPNWLWFYDATQPQEPLGGRSGFIRIGTIQRYPKPAGFPGPKFSRGAWPPDPPAARDGSPAPRSPALYRSPCAHPSVYGNLLSRPVPRFGPIPSRAAGATLSHARAPVSAPFPPGQAGKL